MAKSKIPIQTASTIRGRPRGTRMPEIERVKIKTEICGIYNSLPLFYKEAFAEAGESKYKGFKQPSDLETVKNAFVHFFSGTRSLPDLYWRVLKELLEITPYSSSSTKIIAKRPENPTEFVLTTKNEMPQWADHRELDLGSGRLEVLMCKIKTESPYFRFGFKLLTENERLLGDGSIKSQDANLVVHLGRNNWNRSNLGISAKDIFFTWYLNGISLEKDKRLFSAGRLLSASIEIKIDTSYVATFSVNGICCLNRVIPPKICRRVAVLAWGDREEYAVEVNELSVNPVLGS
jgi:hypothetical protein